jgi:hypothetical protein
MNVYGAFGNTPIRFLFKSGTVGQKANIAYSGTASACNIGYAAFTDIAASPTIKVYNAGTIATTTGVTSFDNSGVGGGGGAGVSVTTL